MTAQTMPPARASTPAPLQRSTRSLRSRSRLQAVRSFSMLLVACALAAACHDGAAPTLSQTDDAAHAPSSAAPLAQGVSAPTSTIAILASPANPMKEAGANASPAAAPLAPPVIHTVD